MTDSLAERENQIPLGMLAKHDIAFLIQQKQIIQNCLYDNLKDAVYEMRLGSFSFRWEGDICNKMRLGDQQNKEKELCLPPNSLTFVTTIEKFNLPANIIARFNLKVDWVHRGLLLGTGPIVNPKFNGYLLIPIHNFSSQTVPINFGDRLISVEFTKIPSTITDCSFKTQPIEEDVESLVKQYCERSRLVESSVYKSIKDSKNEVEYSKKEREKWNKLFSIGGLVAAIGVLIGLIALVFTTWSVHADSRQKILSAHEALLTINNNIEKENIKIRNDITTLKEQIRALSVFSTSGDLPEDKVQGSQGQLNTDVLPITQEDQKVKPPIPSQVEVIPENRTPP